MFQTYTRKTLDLDRWKTLAKDSLFNQLEWLSVWETIGASPLFYLSSTKQSEGPARAFSCLKFGSGVWSRAQSGVDGLAARFLSDSGGDFQIEDHIRDEIFRALKRAGQASATWVDYQRRMNSEKLPGGWRVQQIQTHRLDLTVRAPVFSGSTARQIKSGYERGAAVSEIERVSQVVDCYELMQKAYRKFGRSRMYPQNFYLRLFEYTRVERRILWYICQVDGKTIGNLIALIDGGEALNWQVFIDRDQIEYKPAYLMLARLIEDAWKLKLASVNLGGSPPGASGLMWFKERFGARPYSYPVFASQSPWYRFYQSFRTTETKSRDA